MYHSAYSRRNTIREKRHNLFRKSQSEAKFDASKVIYVLPDVGKKYGSTANLHSLVKAYHNRSDPTHAFFQTGLDSLKHSNSKKSLTDILSAQLIKDTYQSFTHSTTATHSKQEQNRKKSKNDKKLQRKSHTRGFAGSKQETTKIRSQSLRRSQQLGIVPASANTNTIATTGSHTVKKHEIVTATTTPNTNNTKNTTSNNVLIADSDLERQFLRGEIPLDKPAQPFNYFVKYFLVIAKKRNTVFFFVCFFALFCFG